VSTPLLAILLAAGEGTRMNSKAPKVLHPVAGQPMIDYILEDARIAGAIRSLIIVSHKSGEVASHAGKRAIPIVQAKRMGTGHAVQQALPYLRSFKGNVLVLYGDACLLRPQTILALKQFHLFQDAEATLLTANVRDPFGYGRVLRDVEGNI